MKELNTNKAIENFQMMIRKKTVSSKDGNFDKEEFASFLPMLTDMYPALFEKADAQLINEYGILVRFRGKDSSLAPVVLMAHYDVVSDEGQDWKHPAFEAQIHDECIWGRGTIDTKCLVAAAFEAMNNLAENGFTPERDIYFASSNCEEIGGDTMPCIVKWFEENNIKPWFVLDEGGAIMSSLPMGIKTPFAMVALSEKGWATVELTTSAKTAAHSAKAGGSKVSAPMKLTNLLAKLEKNPTPSTITPALEGMLKSFAPYIDGPVSKVLENISLFKPIVKKVMQSNADTAAMIRSSIIVTKIEAGNEKGTVPETAKATVSIKIAPQDNLRDIIAHIRKLADYDVKVQVLRSSQPPAISDYKTQSFDYIKSTIKSVFPDVGVAPFILNAGTDSRHFARICKEVYRFGAFRLDDDLFATVHSANERIPVKDYLKCIEFYTQLISNLN